VNGLERILAAVTGGRPDLTPVAPVLLMQGAKVLGEPLSTYFGTPRRIAEGQLALVERFDHDAVFAFPHVVQDVLPWGSAIDLHDDGPPSVRGMLLDDLESIPSLTVPDPTRHAYTRGTLEAARQLAARVKGDRAIIGAVIGPFSLPSMLMGTKRFLSLLADDAATRERLLPVLLAKMVEYTTRWAQAQLDAGCDLVVIAEGISSASVIDEATFQRHALPTLRETVRRIRGPVALEPVGHAAPFLRHYRDLGIAALLLGEADPLPQARRALGPNLALMGNLNNLKLLRLTPERVRFEARRAIAEAGPAFILSNQGPEVPFDVPDAVIDALVRAARTGAISRRAA
jgi:uroporphyrinogen decarboxylase